MAQILVIAAHLDDEVLGCGGTIAWHTQRNDSVYLCVVTDSSSTQYAGQPEKIVQKKKEQQAAAEVLGIKHTFLLDFPDMNLDTVPHHKVNDALSAVVREVAPDVLYTHYWDDLNMDHVLTFRSSMVALRPTEFQQTALFAYEVLSSTEWALPSAAFRPNSYVDITPHLSTKLEAMGCYKTEVREYPHPRSLQAIEYLARKRGSEVVLPAAEAFILIRQVR